MTNPAEAMTSILRHYHRRTTEARLTLVDPPLQAADASAISFIGHTSNCRQLDLAAYLGVSPTTASSMIDRLVQRDLVLRARVKRDRRSVALVLTSAGETVFEQLNKALHDATADVLDHLSPCNRSGFIDGLKDISAALAGDVVNLPE